MVRSWAPRRDLAPIGTFGPGDAARLVRMPRCVGVKGRAGTRQHAILVVDDDRDVRELWTDTLRELGHEVEEAVDGLHALRLLHDGRLPCMVLSDVRMPRLDGWELAQAVGRDPQLAAVPVVLVTADHVLALTSPASDKPSSLEELDALVERSCTLHRRPYNRGTDEG